MVAVASLAADAGSLGVVEVSQAVVPASTSAAGAVVVHKASLVVAPTAFTFDKLRPTVTIAMIMKSGERKTMRVMPCTTKSHKLVAPLV